MSAVQGQVVRALDFGQNYAILNLDLISVLLEAVKGTAEGQAFILNCTRWNDAVHRKCPQPLTIFTSLRFLPSRPEVNRKAPFAKLIAPLGTFEDGSPEAQIDAHFVVSNKDVVVPKTRLSATTGSCLEQILMAHAIDTVVISGLAISGVVMSTIYRLFDLDFNIFVISDNVVELPPYQTAAFSKAMMNTFLSQMSLKAITIDEALEALERS